MGTQRIENNQSQPPNAWAVPLSNQERQGLVDRTARSMADSFARAVVNAHNSEPMPFWEKAVITAVAVGALTLIVGIPAYVGVGITLKYFGINN